MTESGLLLGFINFSIHKLNVYTLVLDLVQGAALSFLSESHIFLLGVSDFGFLVLHCVVHN